MQGTRVQSLAGELRSYIPGVTKPTHQNYWACEPKLESPCTSTKSPHAATKTKINGKKRKSLFHFNRSKWCLLSVFKKNQELWIGKVLKDAKEAVENSEHFPGSGEAHLQQRTILRLMLGEACSPWTQVTELSRLPLRPATAVCAWSHLETESWGWIWIVLRHWPPCRSLEQMVPEPGCSLGRDIPAGSTSYLLTELKSDRLVTWVGGLGWQGRVGRIIRTARSIRNWIDGTSVRKSCRKPQCASERNWFHCGSSMH